MFTVARRPSRQYLQGFEVNLRDLNRDGLRLNRSLVEDGAHRLRYWLKRL
jgi:hypothetical protein